MLSVCFVPGTRLSNFIYHYSNPVRLVTLSPFSDEEMRDYVIFRVT